MASIINASTAGVGGVITTADNSGILNIQTAGTTAVTIDASQNVGIGTAGAEITFTDAMTLDASKNLSVSGAVQANFNYADTGTASYGAGTSFTLTVSDTTEGAMYLISVSRNVSSLSASNRVALLSYRSSGSFLTDIIANANVTISVSGATITVTGVGTASLYGSVLGLRN